MSDFDELRDDVAAAHPGEAEAAASVAGDSTAAAPVNPRKRKKSSRALVLLLSCQHFCSYQTPSSHLALCLPTVPPGFPVLRPSH